MEVSLASLTLFKAGNLEMLTFFFAAHPSCAAAHLLGEAPESQARLALLICAALGALVFALLIFYLKGEKRKSRLGACTNGIDDHRYPSKLGSLCLKQKQSLKLRLAVASRSIKLQSCAFFARADKKGRFFFFVQQHSCALFSYGLTTALPNSSFCARFQQNTYAVA